MQTAIKALSVQERVKKDKEKQNANQTPLDSAPKIAESAESAKI